MLKRLHSLAFEAVTNLFKRPAFARERYVAKAERLLEAAADVKRQLKEDTYVHG